ncbi:MAG TPA: lamin tail domain-containing protein [Bacteroidales bacterium]|nr:lamin tail domain-containing protein [Bacteroidales bacterium]
MVRRIFTFFFLSFLASHACLAQFSDNFSDGNFTANPVWVGDTDKFIVESEILRLNDNVAGRSYLATQSTMALEVQWDFWVRIAFTPSNSNHPRIYLVSDQQNLREPLNGYFLQIGRDGTDNKRIFLMRQNGTITTTLLSGSQNLATASNNILRIRVTRTAAGRFDVWADATGDNLLLPQGTATDLTFTNTSWFGVVCEYTVTNRTNFYFDDFAVGPIVHDITPPLVNMVEVVSANQINVHFSEVVDLATSQTASNYLVSHSIGSPLTASRNLSRPNIVNLFFPSPLAQNFNYDLSISNVMDQANNVMNPFAVIFALYLPSPFDIVFNEIMANPSPAVSLPPHEYIELYNNSEFTVNLNGWTLQHGTTSRVLPMVNIPPKGYLVLTNEAAVPSLRPFGPVAGVTGLSTTALTNAGTSLFLFAPGGRLISFVSYSDRWYRSPAKSAGGWSLEKIDPLNYCQGTENWRASDHTSGGTPAAPNSILRSNPDITPPDLRRIGYVNPTTLRLFFSEPIDGASIAALVRPEILELEMLLPHRPCCPIFLLPKSFFPLPLSPDEFLR